MGPGVDLRVDELVLHGFSLLEGRRIGDAFGRELERLLRDEGAWSGLENGHTAGALDGGSLVVNPTALPEQIGLQLARLLYESLSGERNPPAGVGSGEAKPAGIA